MDKGVIDPVNPGATDMADDSTSTERSGPGLPRRRRRKRNHHHRHQNLSKKSGKGPEIAFVTLLALGILFGVMYILLERYQRGNDESSQLRREVPACSGRLSPAC
jgi:hypothetical protein